MLPIFKIPTDPTKPIMKGDTWSGVSITITDDLTPVDLTGASIRLHLYHTCGSKIELSTGSGITITDPVNGGFQINSINRLDWKSGLHVGDLEVTYSSTIRKTYIQVHITVTDDITK